MQIPCESGAASSMPMPDNGPIGTCKGFLIAAPSSGAGKTTVTLAILRALVHGGRRVVSAKSGPDYIDPGFHQAASGRSCLNLDAWAMAPDEIKWQAHRHAESAELLVVEGAMGLFDGAANGRGSAADLAAVLGLPVVLVVDCGRQAQSVAALVQGFARFRSDVTVAGLILNRVGSPRHETMLRSALDRIGIPVLGALPRLDALVLPDRHLGLVLADEHASLDAFLDEAANVCEAHLDLAALEVLASPISAEAVGQGRLLRPLGQKIAVARDIAFAFAYPHLLSSWREQGAEIEFFSPLADEVPVPDADAIYLPGGYPELHAGRLAAAERFRQKVREAAESGTLIYGECGGYMTLGETLIDADGTSHEMLGLLPLETSFQTRKRHLGYLDLTPLGPLPWAEPLAAHEFHYATVVKEGNADRLFSAVDATGAGVPKMGLRVDRVMGSFAHVIARR